MHKTIFNPLQLLRFAIFGIAISIMASSCFLFYDDDDDDEITKKMSDWLIVDYFDADNNLNDDLFRDMLYQQAALSTLSGSSSVRILALWDGQSAYGAANQKPQPNTYVHPQAALYELGAASNSEANLILNSERFATSYNTRELTSSVSWLPSEPNMGDVSLLTDYLSWVNKYYSANKVVLMLSDHGAGTALETETGKRSARSLCFDDTNGNGSSLTATDVANAIRSSGLNVSVIWQDCCLQGNVETAYLLRGTADYLVTSANTSYSNNHYAVISSLASSSSSLSFAKSVVKAYADTHKTSNMEMAANEYASYGTALTQAAFSLNSAKQNELYSAIDALASAIISGGKSDYVYSEYLVQVGNDFDNCKGMAYHGSLVYLNDIGYFCKNLIADSSLSSNIKQCASRVMQALDGIIASSWIGTKGSGTYEKNKYSSQTEIQYAKNVDGYSGLLDGQGSFGLTITTQLNPYYEANMDKCYPFYSYYTRLTGYSSNWGELMRIWH